MNSPQPLNRSGVGPDETLQTSRDSGFAERQRLSPGASTIGPRCLTTIVAPSVETARAGGVAQAEPGAPAAGPSGPISEASAAETLLIADLPPVVPTAVGRIANPSHGHVLGSRYDRRSAPFAVGGLGEVYQAQDQELHRQVALKQIKQVYAHQPASRRRFLLEAEITARLEHPGVVPVYGLVQDEEGRPSYAMRLIQGETLRNAIGRFHQPVPRTSGQRGLGLRQLLSRFLAVCATVAYAHSRGIVHCDLKPANIMLGKYGETLVVDWGLARLVERTEADRATGEATLRPLSEGGDSATDQGKLMGTPAYMSPEQAAGRWDIVGKASDVYSLGATLYALLTGQEPVRGKDLAETLVRVEAGRILPPRQVCKGIPSALEAICLKAMAVDPKDRYASPLELADDIERWLADEPVSVYARAWSERFTRWACSHRLTAISGGLAVLLAGVAVRLLL